MINEYEIRRHFSDYVMRCMSEKELKPWYVAYYSEMGESTFRSCMKAAKLPRPVALIMIAELFECSVNELLGFSYFEVEVRGRTFNSGRDTRRVAAYFVEQVVTRMKNRGISIDELATACGVTEPTMNLRMKHPALPTTLDLIRICDVLDCTPSELLGY